MEVTIEQVKRSPSESHDLCEGRSVDVGEDDGVRGFLWGQWLGENYAKC